MRFHCGFIKQFTASRYVISKRLISRPNNNSVKLNPFIIVLVNSRETIIGKH